MDIRCTIVVPETTGEHRKLVVSFIILLHLCMYYFHYFSQTSCFDFDLQKSAQPARTNDGLHPKHKYVTYVTAKELGGNHFAGGCYDCFS